MAPYYVASQPHSDTHNATSEHNGKAHADTSHKKQRPPILSYSRFEPGLRQVCAGLEQDGRREKLFSLAMKQRKEERACASCRALWVSLSNVCKGEEKRERPAKKKKAQKASEAELSEGGNEAGAAEEGPPGPTPTPSPVPPRPKRFPLPTLLDALSRVAVAIHDFDEGGSSAQGAVRNTCSTLLDLQDLTPGEEEYFEIFCEFFEAPWKSDAPESTPTPPPSESELGELFE
jgi:hypothetical protein